MGISFIKKENLKLPNFFCNMKVLFFIIITFICVEVKCNYIFILMDEQQKNHLKAYGLAYYALQKDVEVLWLLNYKAGSFCIPYSKMLHQECLIRDVSLEIISDSKKESILFEISNNEVNQDVIKLEKVPKIAVYSPKTKQPWDDAVTLVLNYAEIPYDVVYDEDILLDKLKDYDWLHLHHEDFTGQYGKFYASYNQAVWYINEVKEQEAMATKMGFIKVSHLKLAVAKRFCQFISNGGFLFAMCSATDSFDIALASEGVDICETIFDHDAMNQQANTKIDYKKGLAFTDYKLVYNPYQYEFSEIDVTESRATHNISKQTDRFKLFDFSAKWDPVPTMLCQNHEKLIKGFYGQTTAYHKKFLKSNVLVMGEFKAYNEARYIHGDLGNGTWTYYGGHDPEDYQHKVEDPPTDLNLHKNSPGYRLILNNVLFPAAKKKKQKT